MSKVPYVCVYASQVAACIGANRHKKVCEAAEALWQRVDPTGYHRALARNGIVTQDQSVETLVSRHELGDMFAKSLQPLDTSTQVAEAYLDASQTLARDDRLDVEEKRALDEAVRRNLYTSYGTHKEHEALEYIRTTLGIACEEDPAFHKVQAGVLGSGVPWYLGGRIDAIDASRQLVIEIKNRVNRLFCKLPFYEVVQVQAYLELLDVERGALVEALAPQGGELVVQLTPIRRNRELWRDQVLPRLRGFVEFVMLLQGDEALQDRYLSSSRRSSVALHYIRKHMGTGV